MAHILILGAGSDIGAALAVEYARLGHDLYLAARDVGRLGAHAADLRDGFGIEVVLSEFEVRDVTNHPEFFQSLDPAPEGVICLVGSMGKGPAPPVDMEDLREVIETNFLGCAAILEVVANAYEKNGRGFIVGVSSVAGERGRQSNYPYGSAKAGFTAYLSGLRQRLTPSGIQLLTVKPGFVRTRMTQGMDLPPLLTAEAGEAARKIARAQRRGRSVAYIRGIWRPIMALIRIIPERIFKRMTL